MVRDPPFFPLMSRARDPLYDTSHDSFSDGMKQSPIPFETALILVVNTYFRPSSTNELPHRFLSVVKLEKSLIDINFSDSRGNSGKDVYLQDSVFAQ